MNALIPDSPRGGGLHLRWEVDHLGEANFRFKN